MIDLIERDMVRPLKVVFLTRDTQEEFDPTSPTVEIRHYDDTTEIIDLPETPLSVNPSVGHYVYSWTVPNDFPINNIAFIYYRGTDVSGNRIVFEEKLRIVPTSFYQIDSSSDMTVKFTKD